MDIEAKVDSTNSKVHFLATNDFKRLRTLSTLQAMLGIARAWIPVLAVFALWFYLQGTVWRIIFLPVFWIVITSRQHALAGLAHESAHRILFKPLFWNDLIGRYCIAFPILVSLSRYRALHLEHHRSLHSDNDPDLAIYSRYPVTKKTWRSFLLRDFRGATVYKNLAYFIDLPSWLGANNGQKSRETKYKSDVQKLWIFHLGVLTCFTVSGNIFAYLLLWWLPYFTILQVLLRIRGALEHGAVRSKNDPFMNTRTVSDHPLVLAIMAPLGLNYHLEHHIYPVIPWYYLKELHAHLLQTQNKNAVQISLGYRSAIRELLKR